MRATGAALALLLLAGLANGPAQAARPVSVACEGGTCTWFREFSRAVAGASARGTLLRLSLHWWKGPARGGAGEEKARPEVLYLLCSGTWPGLVQREGRRWRERPLDPGEPAQADRALAAVYGWACHGILPGTSFGLSLAELYPTRPDALRTGRLLQRPEDVLL